jgi:hypothetical protein
VGAGVLLLSRQLMFCQDGFLNISQKLLLLLLLLPALLSSGMLMFRKDGFLNYGMQCGGSSQSDCL